MFKGTEKTNDGERRILVYMLSELPEDEQQKYIKEFNIDPDQMNMIILGEDPADHKISIIKNAYPISTRTVDGEERYGIATKVSIPELHPDNVPINFEFSIHNSSKFNADGAIGQLLKTWELGLKTNE